MATDIPALTPVKLPKKKKRVERQPGALSCTKCFNLLPPALYDTEKPAPCPSCKRPVLITTLPRFLAPHPPGEFGQRMGEGSGAGCFFHEQKVATGSCDACGRFICAMCETADTGQRICPSCFDAAVGSGEYPVSRLVPGSVAAALTFLPLLIWPVTLITAPLALFLVIFGWNKPGSIVQQSRGMSVLAGVVAALQVVAWAIFGTLFFTTMWQSM